MTNTNTTPKNVAEQILDAAIDNDLAPRGIVAAAASLDVAATVEADGSVAFPGWSIRQKFNGVYLLAPR